MLKSDEALATTATTATTATPGPGRVANVSTTSKKKKEESATVEERNFRSHYYEKVGFHAVDERRTVDMLLNEDPVGVAKCGHFALKYCVPPDRRLELWQVMLGIRSVYVKNRDYVWRWREKSFHDTMRALKAMGLVHDEKPKATNMAVVFLMFKRNIQLNVERQLRSQTAQNFMAIAETVTELSDNDAVVFYVTHEFSSLFQRLTATENIRQELVQLYHRILVSATSSSTNGPTSQLYSHLSQIGLHPALPLTLWLRRGFAGILRPSGLRKLWDKVLGSGSLSILVYLAVVLIEAANTPLLGCQTAEEAIRCLVVSGPNSEDVDERLSKKCLELWVQDGGSTGVASPPLNVAAGTTALPSPTMSTTEKAGAFVLASEIKIT